MENATGTEDFSDILSLEEQVAGCRTAPEFTMQAVSARTGVPSDTIRSWERRYGFPKPGRSEANYRLYSERDIVALSWLRHQTERGQGTREAFGMLHRILGVEDGDTPATPEAVSAAPSPTLPIDGLMDALETGSLADAQRAWDQIALAVSPEALSADVLLRARAHLLHRPEDDHARIQGMDFLLRKAVVLFDQAGPDHGVNHATIVAHRTQEDLVLAYAVGTMLARAGYCISAPVIDATDTRQLLILSSTETDGPVIVVTTPDNTLPIRTCERIVTGREIYAWWPETAAGSLWLPARLHDIPDALLQPR